MSFTIKGTVGSVRHRIHPKKAEVRGPRGVVGKHDRNKYRKRILDATRSFEFAKPKSEGGVLKGAISKVKSFFARGNR